jgi:hypothetical protein
MSLVNTAMILALLTVSLYSLRKLRNMHILLYSMKDQTQRDVSLLYHQLEALIGLYVDLGLTKSLPGTRDWAASPDFLMELVRHALSAKPKTVVECSSGTSTLVLARCMQINGGGKVYSLEHDPIYAQQTRVQLERHGLSEFAEVRAAPITTMQFSGDSWSWYDVADLPDQLNIDLLVIDGPPSVTGPLARYPAGPVLFPRLSERAAVFLDDASREDEKAILLRWSKEFPHLIQSMKYCEKGCAVLRNTTSNATQLRDISSLPP